MKYNAPDTHLCTQQDDAAHGCDICNCEDYSADSSNPDVSGVPQWPRCKCGHLAQDHNTAMSDKLTVAREYGAEFAHELEDITVESAAYRRFPGDEKAQAAFIQGFKDECEADWQRRQEGG